MPRVGRGRDPLSLRSPLAGTPGIGPARARALAAAGLTNVLDLLLELPLRHEDRARFASVADLVPGGPPLTLSGTVVEARLVRTRRPGFSITEATFEDESGQAGLVFYNQPWMARWLTPGLRVFVHGRAVMKRRLTLEAPHVEAEPEENEADAALSVGRVVPIYRSLPGLPPRVHRRLVARALEEATPGLPERLSAEVVRQLGLPPLAPSLREAHFPGSAGGPPDPGPWAERSSPHLKRLALEELLEFQVALLRRRRERATRPAPRIEADAALRAALAGILPFPLTGAQKQAIREIGADLRSGHPMARLLQGDVGSGKTIVAVLTAVLAAGRGFQSALMAPTTILAEQHAETVFRLLSGSGVKPALLTARVTGRPRAALLAALEEGEIGLLVGTHALLEKPVAFRRLGLVVVDEQHRFGVSQRAALPARAVASGLHPHVLVLSATPIPRSLALALHGDLDVSTLGEKPPGRTPIVTRVAGEGEREQAYRALARDLESGGRAFVVVPLVEDSETIDARAVASWTEEVARRLPGRRVGAIHGKMRAEAREKAMRQFAAGELDVLVATTVVEVGIDVPEASFLLVENAERFGLAQLHQLRGRIGRGTRASTCLLLPGDGASAGALARLGVLARTEDGFEIADEDLRMRGPGEALGTRQSGLPEFRIADPLADRELLAKARELALQLAETAGTPPFEEALLLRSARR
ncbi:MAG: ATP-dependent DNA helicase RecG [Holophagales bacterium]|nr:ATP-dependent DNA helicase RecG [Holophagales bacterium]